MLERKQREAIWRTKLRNRKKLDKVWRDGNKEMLPGKENDILNRLTKLLNCKEYSHSYQIYFNFLFLKYQWQNPEP